MGKFTYIFKIFIILKVQLTVQREIQQEISGCSKKKKYAQAKELILNSSQLCNIELIFKYVRFHFFLPHKIEIFITSTVSACSQVLFASSRNIKLSQNIKGCWSLKITSLHIMIHICVTFKKIYYKCSIYAKNCTKMYSSIIYHKTSTHKTTLQCILTTLLLLTCPFYTHV